MNRKDVQALLQACERDRIGPHPDNETLAALCRAWLALDGAPEGRLGIGPIDDDGDMVEIVMDPDTVRHLHHRRVRIVPVD